MDSHKFIPIQSADYLEPQSLVNDSKENEAILSEDALRQLSKSLTKLVPSDVDILEKDVLEYGSHKQNGEDH